MIPLPKCVYCGKRKYKVNLAYDVVLRVLELHKDQLFEQSHMVNLSLFMFIGWKAHFLSAKAKACIYDAIFTELIPSDSKKHSGPDVLSFQQDAEYIYSAFLQAYGIDLMRERGKLDWRLFMALLKGLPEDTKLRYIMNIRGRELPAPTKHNQKEIKQLIKDKQYWAIRENVSEENFQQSLNTFAASLARQVGGAK